MNELFKQANAFVIEGNVTDVRPYGDGHINVTYLVTTDKKRYIMQRMNTRTFQDPKGLMRNICAVTAHLRSMGVETLNVVPTRTGESFVFGETCWRMYDFIEGTETYQKVTDPAIFRASGEAFGEFQNFLASFDATKLVEVIPHFHDTPKRYRDFTRAAEQDSKDRAKTCRQEIDFVHEHRETYGVAVKEMGEGTLPFRVTHNDTKLNNVLLDAVTGKARAVIDLDTVMPGSMLFDFGDSIRFGAATAAEDEKDHSKMNFSEEYFQAYAEGYLGKVKNSITLREAELLPYGAYLMTIECGMRFLADYLEGDVYFATKYPEHNLVRARNQLILASQMEHSFPRMSAIISSLL